MHRIADAIMVTEHAATDNDYLELVGWHLDGESTGK
jgi:hypothetical protein